MSEEEYSKMKIGAKVHHMTKNEDLYLKYWIYLHISNKYIGGFVKDESDLDKMVGLEDIITVSPEYIELV